MYLLTWNSLDSRIEASFGGSVTSEEVARFGNELQAFLERMRGEAFRVLVDFSTVNDMPKKVEKSLGDSREACLEYGAEKVTFVTGDPDKAEAMTAGRMQNVLEGREQYLPFQRSD